MRVSHAVLSLMPRLLLIVVASLMERERLLEHLSTAKKAR
jgi:hypothetical protein